MCYLVFYNVLLVLPGILRCFTGVTGSWAGDRQEARQEMAQED